jgi:hypothetical protein
MVQDVSRVPIVLWLKLPWVVINLARNNEQKPSKVCRNVYALNDRQDDWNCSTKNLDIEAVL